MLIRLIFDGKHTYAEVRDSLLDEIRESGTKHAFVIKDGNRFEYAGNPDGIHTFKKVDILDLKVAQFANRLVRSNHIKLATSILERIPKSESQIDEFIKNIGVPRDSTKIEQIKEIKKKSPLYPKDQSVMKLLWWEAKRDALRDKMQRLNIEIRPTEQEQSFLQKVIDELSNRITKAIKEVKNYPEV